jgi:hypothetical protein
MTSTQDVRFQRHLDAVDIHRFGYMTRTDAIHDSDLSEYDCKV